jgi:adenosine deaminase
MNDPLIRNVMDPPSPDDPTIPRHRTIPPQSAPAGLARSGRCRVPSADYPGKEGYLTEAAMHDFLRGLPKAELHIHIEGSLEPELIFGMADRNGVRTSFASVAELRAAYRFSNLQEFLDIYYVGADVLQTETDFYEMTRAYLHRAATDGVRRAEIFFDPQTHTARGVPIEAVIDGIHAATVDSSDLGISTGLILCFLRHLPAADAMATLEAALPRRDRFIGIGLDSSEVGHPPELFRDVFARAAAEGLHRVAHAGEEGPPEYVWGALDVLGAERIDHGVRSLEDPELVRRLAAERVPLTVCPLSNVKLGGFPRLEDHSLPRMIEAGLMVTINSDDPAYFGGYVAANYSATQTALGFSRDQMVSLAANSIEASFLDVAAKKELRGELTRYAATTT